MKKSKSMNFEKATIDISDMTITEYIKDQTNTFDIMSILKEWSGIDNISLSIKTSDTVDEIDVDMGTEEFILGEDT